jgi:hypothetical protein
MSEHQDMSDKALKSFDRCPRCRKSWEMFPVFRCPNCELCFCGCCDEPERPDGDAEWLLAVWAELKDRACPACTGPIVGDDQIGWIKKPLHCG